MIIHHVADSLFSSHSREMEERLKGMGGYLIITINTAEN
jgi:hypothetical protein